MRGAMLELVTVGFYRFWLATDMRRHLWSHTAVEGDTLEYTGTAKELLLGFLFAVAILAPLYLIYFLIGLEAERARAFASFPLGLFYYFFIQFAVYRARRYRVTRTVWRGVRFWMTGSGISYAWRVALWSLLATVTLGIALPWRQAALERYKMRHTSYGTLSGRFVGTGLEFFKRGWGLWLAVLAMVLVPFLVGRVLHQPGLFVILFFVEFLSMPVIYGMYKAIEWRWWVSGIRFDSVYFESNLQSGDLMGLYWKVIGWNVLLVVALTIWVGCVYGIAVSLGTRSGMTAQNAVLVLQHYPVLIAVGFGYVVTILAFWTVMRIYLVHDVWQRVAMSATVHNLGTVDNIIAQGHLVGALGEGFADSLDVVGF
jgi:uncharacterized membrane protein YjgN (DUF898 family)